MKISLRAKAGVPETVVKQKFPLHSVYLPQNTYLLTESRGEFSDLHSICRLCALSYFNENPGVQAFAKFCEHEQFEQKPNFVNTFKLNGTVRKNRLHLANSSIFCAQTKSRKKDQKCCHFESLPSFRRMGPAVTVMSTYVSFLRDRWCERLPEIFKVYKKINCPIYGNDGLNWSNRNKASL